jgi:hypothetical protein
MAAQLAASQEGLSSLSKQASNIKEKNTYISPTVVP